MMLRVYQSKHPTIRRLVAVQLNGDGLQGNTEWEVKYLCNLRIINDIEAAIYRYRTCSQHVINTLDKSRNKPATKVTQSSLEKPKHPEKDV